MAVFTYLVSSNSENVQKFIDNNDFVFIVDGNVENITKHKHCYVFDHHRKGGGKTSVNEFLDSSENYELFCDVKNAIEKFEEKNNKDAKIGIITPQLDSDAICIASIIVYEIQSEDVINLEQRWVLDAISENCDYLSITNEYAKKHEDLAIAFDQILKQDVNRIIEENGLSKNRREWTLLQKDQVNSDAFYEGIMRVVQWLQGDDPLIWDDEWTKCQKYIQNQNKLRDYIAENDLVKIHPLEYPCFDARNIKEYCDPRNWYSVLESMNKSHKNICIFVREIIEDNEHKAWAYTIALKPNSEGDLSDLWDLLNEQEQKENPDKTEKWGGRSAIGGSPRNEGSQLGLDTVVDIINYFEKTNN